MKKPNKITKANGGKKPTRDPDWVYFKGDTKDRGWTNESDWNGGYDPSIARDEWENECEHLIGSLDKFYRVLSFYDGIEQGLEPNDRELLIFKTDFFTNEHFTDHFAKFIPIQNEFVEDAIKCGLWNEKVSKKIKHPIAPKKIKDACSCEVLPETFLYLRLALQKLVFISRAAEYITNRFMYNVLISKGVDGFEGDSFRELGLDPWDTCDNSFDFKTPPASAAQAAIDWYLNWCHLFEWADTDLNYLVTEIGMVCGHPTRYPMPYWKEHIFEDDKKQFEYYKEFVSNGETFDYNNEISPLGSLRLWSFALKAAIDGDDAKVRVKFKNPRLGEQDYEITKLIKEDFPKAKLLLEKIDIVKWRRYFDQVAENFDRVTFDRHTFNFENYDLLTEIINWAEDYIFAIGFWEEDLEPEDHENMTVKLGQFLEALDQVASWATDTESGDLGQLTYLFSSQSNKNPVTDTVKLPTDDEIPSQSKPSLTQNLSDVLLKIAEINKSAGVTPGTCYTFWQQSLTKGAAAPIGLMNHITNKANDIPWRTPYKMEGQKPQGKYFPKGADSWKSFLLVWGEKNLQEKTFYTKKDPTKEHGNGTPSTYYAPKGKKTKCDAMKVAKKMVELCDQSEIQDRVNIWKTKLKM